MGSPRRKPLSPELLSISAPRNLTITTEATVHALSIGVPSYAARRRRIEDGIDDLLSFLEEHADKLAERGASPAEITRATAAAAQRIDFSALNRLIAAHNRFYPIEANLPVDPKTGAFVVRRDTPFETEPELGPERLLALFAERDAALS